MSEFNEYGQDRAQQMRSNLHASFGDTGRTFSTSSLRKAIEEYGDDFDLWIPRVTGVVFGGLAASGAAAGSFGVAAVAGGSVGYGIGHKFGSLVTGKVKNFIKTTLDEIEQEEAKGY
jgi:hypothetical protein